jgi:putative transcription antitermination factor YqgF
MTARARGFARSLETRFALPVAVGGERWTSEAAVTELRNAGRGGRSGRTERDEAAARIILQAWFDEPHER